MARPLPTLPMQKLLHSNFLPAQLITFLIVLTAVFSVFTAVTFLCGSHKLAVKSLRNKEEKKTVRLGGKKSTVLEKMQSSKALLMAKMISWRKLQDEDVQGQVFDLYKDEDGENGAVWKKTIIKGEKCRPLNFSGKILYDSEGNLLPD